VSELDPNQIISNVISNKIDETIGAIKDAFGGALDKAKAKLNIGYSDYIKRNYARCAQIKTILYRHQPVLLKKHYISPCLQVGKKKCEESAIFEKLGAGTRVVVIGTAGSGKSLFMKNAYIEFVNSGKRFVPIFIELRGLNEDGAKLLKHHILAEIQVIAQAVTEEFFDLGLKNGSFAFFLDGFDEIDYRKNKRVEKEILALTNSSPKCAFIISSRPDDRFFSWQEFIVYKILPMTQTQVVSLISKIEYEEVVKTKFISKIKSDLYKSHEEFLSNPLLATIMLLTFEQIADIPENAYILSASFRDAFSQARCDEGNVQKREIY